MTHDPICLVWASEFCVCPLIRLVRANERDKAAQRIEELGCSEHCGCSITIPNAAAIARGEAS